MLNDEQVADRVNTTLKLSNVTGDSAEQVSSYMTAIWNNFADGSQSLESFADKITALGAATASSSAEIANGLQQFAAIGNTVGLSYDYAATALATVVAQTRQSETVVGNAFRTIFSRLQGLSLGETLEDGTDLNKYSKALASVDVNIKDATGNLRSMDDILDDLGAKWKTLSKDQQTALAQTVGGTRQYTQLIALMDNWDKFQQNLQVTQNSEGTLDKQAEIYAESWEAARKRVQASWQAIYQDLLDDKFFIGLTDGFSKFLEILDKIIDSMGGLKGTIASIGVLVNTVFAKQMVSAIQKTQKSISETKWPWQKQSLADQRNNQYVFDANASAIDLAKESLGNNNITTRATVQFNNDLANLYAKINVLKQAGLETDQKEAQTYAEILKHTGQILVDTAKEADNTGKTRENTIKILQGRLKIAKTNANLTNNPGNADVIEGFRKNIANPEWLKHISSAVNPSNPILTTTRGGYNKLLNLYQDTDHWDINKDSYNTVLNNTANNIATVGRSLGINEKYLHVDELKAYLDAIIKNETALKNLAEAQDEYKEAVAASNEETEEAARKHENVAKAYDKLQKAEKEAADTQQRVDGTNKGNKFEKFLVNLNPNNIVNITQGLTQFSMGVSSITSLLDAFANKTVDASGAILSLSMGIPALVSGFQALQNSVLGLKGAVIVAVLEAAAYAISKIVKYFKDNSSEAKLEKLKDDTEAVTNRAQKLASAYDDVKSSIESLDSGLEKIKGLTKGTVDWTQAVQQNNEQVLKLLDTYDLFDKKNYNWVNGVLSLTDEGKEAVTKAAAIQASNASLASYALKSYASQKTNELSVSNLSDKISNKISGKINDYVDNNGDGSYYAGISSEKNIQNLINEINEGKITLDKTNGVISSGGNIIDEQTLKLIDLINGDKELVSALSENTSALNKNNFNQEAYQTEIGNELTTDYSNNQLGLNDYARDSFNNYLGEVYSSAFNTELFKIEENFNKNNHEMFIEGGKYFDTLNSLGYRWSKADDSFVDQNNDKVTSAEVFSALASENIKVHFDSEQEIKALAAHFLTNDKNKNLPDEIKDLANALGDADSGRIAYSNSPQEANDKANYANDHPEPTPEDIQSQDANALKSNSIFDDDEIEEWNKYVDFLEKTVELGGQSQEVIDAVATANMRLNRGVEDLIKNYDDYYDIIQQANQEGNETLKNSKDYADAVEALGKDLKDITGVDVDALSDGFLDDADNLNLLQEAAYGSADAINALRKAALEDIIVNAGISLDQVTSDGQTLQSLIDNLNLNDIEIGASFKGQKELYQAFDQLIANGQMTADEVNAALASIGYSPVVDFIDVPMTQEQRSQAFAAGKITYSDPETGESKTLEIDQNDAKNWTYANGHLQVPVIKGTTGGKGVATIATPKTMASALASSTFTGGVGKNLSPSNRTAGQKAGKGGGGSKKKTAKDHKDLEKQEDRYHNIKELLNDINTELSRLDKIEDRVYGKARLKYMDQNIDKLKQQLKLTDEYIAEIKEYAAKDQAKLSGIGMGAQYDANGRLTNYEEVLQNIVADYNSAINTYNAAVDTFNASAQEDSDNAILDAADKTVDAAKKKYDENKKILDQYEDTYNLLQEQLDKRIDQVWALFDKRLEEITYSVEFQLDWNDRDVEYFDWLLKYIGKDSINASDAIANLAQQMNEYGDSIDTIKEGIKGIFGLHGLSFNFDNPDAKALYQGLAKFMDATGMESQLTQDEGKALEDYMSKLMDYYTKMDEAWQNAHEHLMDAWSEWNDKLEDGITSISNYGDEMAHIQKIIDATGQKMLRLGSNDLNKMNQQIVDNAREQLKAEKSLLDAMEPSVERAKKAWQDAISAGLSQEVIDKLEEEYKKMRNDYNDQLNDYYSAWENTLDKVEDAFSRALDNMENDYNNTFSKLGLNYLSDEFDRQKDIRDLYLDDYEKYHELNKSAKELADSLEKTTNNMIRGKMADLQDEINAKMNTGVKISEAEAEIIARRVALLQAEADLMDAQNAKSMVRMTRDNEGNFSYTYTADQDAIDDAQGNYGDKFYDLLDYERNYMDQIQQGMLEKRRQFLEDLRNIAEEYKDDPDAYAQAYAQLLDDYNDYNDYFIDQQQMDFDEMARLRDDDWQDTENLTNLKLAEQDDFITQFHDSIYGGLVPDYQTAAEEGNNWANAMQTACDSATQAITTYEQNSRTTYEAAGQDIEKYGQKAGQVYDDLAQKSENTANEVANDGDQMSGTMAQIQNDAWSLDAAWGSVCDSIRNQIAMTVNALSTLLQSLDRAVSKAQTTVAQLQQSAQQAQAAQQAIQNAQNSGSNGNGNNNSNAQGDKTVPNTGVIGTAWGALNGAHNQGRKASTQKAMNLYKQQFGFDTGGYTGRWGSDGRLAMLHEKELVLNKEDTANMLDMVNTVRDMVTSIGSNGMLDKTILSAANAAGMIGPTNTNLDQNVHIEASFPNVESHTEIETALNNLINSASQYVNRR